MVTCPLPGMVAVPGQGEGGDGTAPSVALVEPWPPFAAAQRGFWHKSLAQPEIQSGFGGKASEECFELSVEMAAVPQISLSLLSYPWWETTGCSGGNGRGEANSLVEQLLFPDGFCHPVISFSDKKSSSQFGITKKSNQNCHR